MQAIDIVKAEPKSELELWAKWLNNMQSEVLTAPWTPRKKIEIKYIAKLDEQVCPENSRGRIRCERQGEHSWFNHSMDKAY